MKVKKTCKPIAHPICTCLHAFFGHYTNSAHKWSDLVIKCTCICDKFVGLRQSM